jgi:putative redox protein
MKSVHISWRPGTARFVARGASGATISVAAPDEPDGIVLDDGPHGPDAGPGPAELLLVAGGTCAAWDVVEILRKSRQDVAAIDVGVDGEQQAEAPWTFQRVALRFTVRGRGLSVPAVERAVALSVERYCSVLSTLAAAATIEHRVEVVEDSPAA